MATTGIVRSAGPFLYEAQTVDIASVAAVTTVDTSITMTGAAVGDIVLVDAPSIEDGIVLDAAVTAADTVTLRALNITAGAIDPASQTMYFLVIPA